MDGGTEVVTRGVVGTEAEQPDLPDYLTKTYTWAYLTPASLFFLDNSFVPSAILWGNLPRLVRYACAEFLPGQRVLQAAHVYGTLAADLARTVGPDGRLDVIDIAPIQVEQCRKKVAKFAHARARVADAAHPGGGVYDGVCCFFLLHEVPDEHKHRVVDGLLGAVQPGGKVVFIDYHQAASWHPLRGLMHLVFRSLEPYALGLVEAEVQDFASDPELFDWSKDTYFGGLYQKVVAIRKA